ncbi:hypothetical protein C1X75_13195 [Pseudomonas sp. FW305-17]|nr:hypothetical protein C1X79_06710 [Pseudomonas sp. FW305-42]PNA24280.1 hypothetical protein C1X78_11690 [Pseudomonas sp. MPR-R1B]PNB24928.1 hypothetical protein C1X80_15770 [Pseudomonas sp. DP16D-E2]PNB42990.1 hypothetical protein C1X75_13195 [Pseudomonas sp. FW305-17]PNB63352.1 hypothetical protein C1X77_06990 [Pseudomonas sp. GW531-E2]PNB66877.1 hypothetical protein C1X76_16785 [Pseudomonas sp. FW305-127]
MCLQLLRDWEAPIFKELVFPDTWSTSRGFGASLNLNDQLAFVKSLLVASFKPCYLPFLKAKGSTLLMSSSAPCTKTACMPYLVS